MSRAGWGYLIWTGWLLLFGGLEAAGYLRVGPWPTFSWTVWRAETHPLVAPFVFATLVTLILHFLYHRPLWHAAVFALVVAAGAHLLDRAWP